MRGRTCVVTGASSGIGRATARALAGLGADVVLVCRDVARSAAARADVAAASAGGAVDVVLGDLAVQRDVRRVAAELLARFPALHVLVHNAGVVNLRHATTPDGIEVVFAVNHLAPFLLTHLLRDRLVASAPARVVTVASAAHQLGTIDFDDLGRARAYRWMPVYAQSKLANVLFTYELARRLAGTGVTANCVHPGAVGTRLGQNNGRIATALTWLLRPLFRSAERGADTVVWLASAPDVATVTGRYFVDRRPRTSSAASRDEALARRLWDVSARLTGIDAAA